MLAPCTSKALAITEHEKWIENLNENQSMQLKVCCFHLKWFFVKFVFSLSLSLSLHTWIVIWTAIPVNNIQFEFEMKGIAINIRLIFDYLPFAKKYDYYKCDDEKPEAIRIRREEERFCARDRTKCDSWPDLFICGWNRNYHPCHTHEKSFES